MSEQREIEHSTIITETVKKSKLRAKMSFDFQKLQAAKDHFLSMSLEEDLESVVFTYQIKRLTSFTEVRKEEYVTILNLLICASDFYQDVPAYSFSMEPANLYYNSTGKLYIKDRDLGLETESGLFLLSYKALIGCALTGAYSYEDYLKGGEELFQKSAVTQPLFTFTEVEMILDYLEELKDHYIQKEKKNKVSVNRKKNLALKLCVVVLILTTIGLGIYGGIQYFKRIPYLSAINNASNAYIENDSIGLIDALEEVDTADLDKHQKYILALAYLQSENLTSEQKTNITEKVTMVSNEKVLEYWISIGRMQVTEAENLAMQLSEDELLLYAYMKEKDQIESDTSMTGSEKEQSIQDIQSKIDSLVGEYELGTSEGSDAEADSDGTDSTGAEDNSNETDNTNAAEPAAN